MPSMSAYLLFRKRTVYAVLYVSCTEWILLVVLLYCYCRYVPVVPELFQQYQYITTAPKPSTVHYILYYGSAVNMILYYGSLTVPSIVPYGIWNSGMVNGIILPTPDIIPQKETDVNILFLRREREEIFNLRSNLKTYLGIKQRTQRQTLYSKLSSTVF